MRTCINLTTIFKKYVIIFSNKWFKWCLLNFVDLCIMSGCIIITIETYQIMDVKDHLIY